MHMQKKHLWLMRGMMHEDQEHGHTMTPRSTVIDGQARVVADHCAGHERQTAGVAQPSLARDERR